MARDASVIAFTLDGNPVEVTLPAAGGAGPNLADVLRHRLGASTVKDGCSPQGQCGCCTVLVDGAPRVACVTPVRRVAGRTVTTLDGLDERRRAGWAEAFCATGASQCGFCTPGIIVRLDAVSRQRTASTPTPALGAPGAAGGPDAVGTDRSAEGTDRSAEGTDRSAVGQVLLAHLCRCTGWQTIFEAWDRFHAGPSVPSAAGGGVRDLEAAGRRAAIEGGVGQRVGPEVALGHGGFACDTAPDGALVALSDGAGGWVVGEDLLDARARLHKVQGRRTTVAHSWPLEVPEGRWAATLRTTWVEPAYLETDASWCEPGGTPWSAVANGGAFGAKTSSPVPAAARALADQHGRTVLALATREDATRWGAKRPPVAGAVRDDGTGVLRIVATPGLAEVVGVIAPGLVVEEVPVPGPPTSAAIRGAGWVEAAVLLSALGDGPLVRVRAPGGGEAEAEVTGAGIRARVRCGQVLDEVVLRSYCIGAAHMAWSWVTSEAITVDADGVPADLTIRSFGVARAVDTPPIEIEIDTTDSGPPVNGSDAVFAAVAAATWRAAGHAPDWPVGRPAAGS